MGLAFNILVRTRISFNPFISPDDEECEEGDEDQRRSTAQACLLDRQPVTSCRVASREGSETRERRREREREKETVRGTKRRRETEADLRK